MAQTLTRLLVHSIFSTKNRANLIQPEIEPELYAYIGGICRNAQSPLLSVGGTANHLHLLFSLSKTGSLADLMLDVKKDSSKWIKTKAAYFADFQWQEGYGGFSIGESQVDDLKGYIARQKEHHRTVTFEEEYLAFVKKYNAPYDERYMWG
ncbi:MAG TPA: transposase [Phycisphaerae bacterium]|nr:transposase [Phycisphaerae bacterium]